MSISVASNIASLSIQRQLGQHSSQLSDTYQRLSSGLRINKASDDAAGLALGTELKAHHAIYTQAVRNVNDSISFFSIYEGALTELSSIVARQKELAEQAANGVYTATQRRSMDTELNALVDEYNRIIASTTFNGRAMLATPGGTLSTQAGIGANAVINNTLADLLDRTTGNGTFASAVTFTAGDSPEGLITADFNGDGNLDVATGDSGNQVLSVYLGNGSGSFATRVSYATGVNGLVNLQAGDINGDGRVDLISVANNADKIAVFLGTGTGTFGTVTTYAAGDNPQGLAIGDLNGDNIKDIVTSNSNTNSISVLIGNGSGGFAAPVSYLAGSSTQSVVLHDFNGDGKLDAAANNLVGDSVSVFMGTGSGGFGAAVSYYVGNGPEALAMADVDGDGNMDLLVANEFENTVGVIIGSSSGTFSTVVSYQVGSGPVGIASADINGDGYAEIVTANYSGDSVSVLINTGSGSFQQSVSYTAGNGPVIPAIGDFNNDGAADIVNSNQLGDSITLFLSRTQTLTTMPLMNITTVENALSTLSILNGFESRISLELGNAGAANSRFEVAVSNLISLNANLETAVSRIMDADIAAETAEMVRLQVIQNAATAVLAQANQSPQLVLELISG